MDFQRVTETFESGLFASLGVIAVLLGAIFVTRWLLLPFAVFGIRNRMDRIVTQMAEMKSQLQHITNVLDPDGVKARLHEQYAASLVEQRVAECPHCHRKVSLKSMPAGVHHQCPHCKQDIEESK